MRGLGRKGTWGGGGLGEECENNAIFLSWF